MRLLVPMLLASSLSAQAWPTAKPAAMGVNPAVLDSIDAEIKAGQYGYVDRFLVIRKGTIVFDGSYRHDYVAAYGDSAKRGTALVNSDRTGPFNYFNAWWHPTYRGGDLHTLQSVTKTVTSVVIGTAVTRGEFPSLDTPILTFYDTTKVANIDDRKRRITIRHLLTMTGGFDWNENTSYSDTTNSASRMEASHDWVGFTINHPMAREPGTRFNYSSGESELLADIFRKATGVDIEEYAARHLFAPLGITRWFWKRTPAGLIDTEGGLYLEARDLARIWQLFGQGGMWHGTRVVSADWVTQSITPAIATGTAATSAKYGLKWWLHANPLVPGGLVWSGSGFGGQFPYYFPERDLIVVFNAWNILPGGKGMPQRRMLERLGKAVAVEK